MPGNLRLIWCFLSVADPVVEQIPENIKFITAGSFLLQKAEKCTGYIRQPAVKMEIRDEDSTHPDLFFYVYAFNNNSLQRNVTVEADASGSHLFDCVNNVLSGFNFTENTVAPSFLGF